MAGILHDKELGIVRIDGFPGSGGVEDVASVGWKHEQKNTFSHISGTPLTALLKCGKMLVHDAPSFKRLVRDALNFIRCIAESTFK